MGRDDVTRMLGSYDWKSVNQILLELHIRGTDIGEKSIQHTLLSMFRGGLVERRIRDNRVQRPFCRPMNAVYEYRLIVLNKGVNENGRSKRTDSVK